MTAKDEKPAEEQRVFKDTGVRRSSRTATTSGPRCSRRRLATRTAWVTCPHCKHRHEVEVADIRARTDAAKALHELAGGAAEADE